MMIIKPFQRGNCILNVKLEGDIFLRLGGLPGRKKWQGRLLIFEASGANIEFIYNNWPTARWEDGAEDLLKAYLDRQGVGEATRTRKESGVIGTTDFKFKKKPYQHQLQCFLLNKDLDVYAYIMEQGTGKSKVALDTAAYLYQKMKIDCMVIVAPKGPHQNWPDEQIPEHYAGKYRAVTFSSNVTARLKKKVEELKEYKAGLKIISFNVESFTSTNVKAVFESFLKTFNCLLLIDESTIIKNLKAQRTKYLIKQSVLAKYRRIATGTPITKGTENLFTQFKFLHPDILGFNSFWTFRNQYCRMGGFKGKQIVGYQNIDDLRKRISGFSYRITKAECLDLPEKIYKRWPIELTAKQREVYSLLKKECILDIEGSEKVEILLAMTRSIKLQLITSNWYHADNPLAVDKEHNPRLEALMNILEELEGEKVIIWARFKNDLKLLTEKLGAKAISYYGDVPEDEKSKAIKLFQNDPKKLYLVSNPRSGGYGFNLTVASNMIYYSNDYDLEYRLQSEDRCHRIGQERHVVIYDIEARKTVDQKIIKSLKNKKSIADTIHQDPKSFFMEEEDDE